jgi:hypothetical protein
MNLIFISPNFPVSYWNFCDRLRRNGVNVLGIGDCPYDYLSNELKSSVTEYYKVDTLEDYDSVMRAVAFFTFKYGKIDWLESNNEYWLELDARLRKDFNINTGVQPEDLLGWKSKSAMKKGYAAAGIPAAREHLVTDIAAAREFIRQNGGYPVFAKPNVGVGASDTFKIENDADLEDFFARKPDEQYIMEEFIFGDIYTYDAVCDSNGDPLFESSFHSPNVAETVNNGEDCFYYVTADVPDKLKEYGRKALKAFSVKSRFVHFEFFRLNKGREGLGKEGDYVGLEVNMRPAGGYTPDMMNFAHSTDVYQIWADMVTDDLRLVQDSGPDCYCVFAGRKDSNKHTHTHDEIIRHYGDRIMMADRMPDIFAAAMGNQMYILLCDNMDEVREAEEYING